MSFVFGKELKKTHIYMRNYTASVVIFHVLSQSFVKYEFCKILRTIGVRNFVESEEDGFDILYINKKVFS
jgi:hypothetical protein